MPGKTNTEKIDDARESIAQLRVRAEQAERELAELRTSCRNLQERLIRLEEKVNLISESRSTWGNRFWNLLALLLAAAAGAALTYFLRPEKS